MKVNLYIVLFKPMQQLKILEQSTPKIVATVMIVFFPLWTPSWLNLVKMHNKWALGQV